MTIFSISFILYFTAVVKAAEATTNNYSQLEPEKFDKDRIWLVDLINTNDKHHFYNVFYFKNISYCLFFKMQFSNFENAPGIYMRMYFKSSFFALFFGIVHGKFIYYKGKDDDFSGCPREKRLEFVYTDYTTIVVLMGDDSSSDRHIMVLRSSDTNMTNEQRKTLIESRTKLFLDFDNLKKEDNVDCDSIDYLEYKKTTLHKCLAFFEIMKKKINSDIIGYLLLLSIVVVSLSCIIFKSFRWFVKRKIRAQVAPAQR